ncbi:protein piccolo isoform X9 [Channa argus]|uniref:protein piccolo isoform X9 n=1 Tax=Channa argus TaxID=215402 RepID=UPI003521EAA6
MFSSKFLSGAVSSAVNKFGLFGDDGEEDKNQKAPPHQVAKSSAEQQPAGPGKGSQQPQGTKKSGQTPPMQNNQPSPKQGSPQLCKNGQAASPSKPGGQPSHPKTETQPKGPLQQGSPNAGAQQQIMSNTKVQPGSPKPSSQQQVQTKTEVQQHGFDKTNAQQRQLGNTGGQGSTNIGPQKTGLQQGSPKAGKEQGSLKSVQQQQGSSKVEQQQQGLRTTSQQRSSDKPQSQQQGPKGSSTPGLFQPGSSSPGQTKAGLHSKAVAKSLCPVCKTTELNMHTKEPPNHKSCTHCKTEVCSLCGFSPPDSEGHEWLCLNCQIQRAQGTSQSVGPSMKMPMTHKVSAAQHQTSSSVAAVKQDMSGPDSSQKMQLTSAKVPGKGEAAEGPESKTQASPASVQKLTPETQRASRSQKPDKTIHTESKLPSATPAPQQESGGLFGFGSAKTGPAKPEESVSEKMFGFGSSIFSSASSLMASAHHDELKTTPPVSPKMQSRKETKPLSVEKSDQDKKQEQPNQPRASPAGQAKVDKTPSGTPFAAAASQSALKAGQSTCPICKVMLNTGTKDPPNYNTCTDCKSTVCNQCGFNPMPNVKEGKEWLCLNCQVKRAAKETEPQKHTHLVDSSLKKTSSAQPASQKTSQPGSPQRKISTPAAQPPKADAAKGIASHTQDSTVPGQKIPQESQKAGPPKQPDHTTQPAQKQVNATAATQQESGGFFGFGGPKGQTDAAKPTGSVTGKMFGFGSSIFSSASTLISSAVQDESKTTPPVSPKMPAPKDSKSPTAKKSEQDKKPEQPQQAKGSPSVQPKVEKPPAEPPKQASASVGKSTCPLCKLPLNVGSKDPPNYNICTECKITVCSQCGFNPMPNVKEVKEWLCLNCQMQRALGASEPPGTPLMKLQGSPNKGTDPAKTLKKETLQLDKPQKKDIPPTESKIKTSAPGSPQRKLPTDQLANSEVMKGPESKKQVSPAPCQKSPQDVRKIGPQKQPEQTSQTGVNTTSNTQGESGGFFGFGNNKPQLDAPKPAESMGGKMFGFGSSIFSSASTLINSAVQDESKPATPVSPKMPAKSPLVQRKEKENKLQQAKQQNISPLLQAKVEKAPSNSSKDAAPPDITKTGQFTCPLCKVELTIGSKERPNYKNCTECKNTVCNQCGFNPMPNVSEVKEWLCLNCQMQRALSASELTGPPMKTQGAVEKISPSVVHSKITPTNQEETVKKDLSKSDTSLKMEPQMADTLQQKGIVPSGFPQKTEPTVVTKTAKNTKEPESDTQANLTPGQKNPLALPGLSGSQKPTDQANKPVAKQSKVSQDSQDEPGSLFGTGGPKTAPNASKTTESVSRKMLGFGSTIYSSASTLISSAVPEESQTTPPGLRKMSAPAQVSPKLSAVPKISPKSTPTISPKMSPAREPKTDTQKPKEKKKEEESHQSKEDAAPSQPPKAEIPPNMGKASCPLCKVELNIGSKDPLDYNTCTECKTTVCNQCGFNPIPIGEVKEWLCLNCQMKRALGVSEPPGPPTVKPKTSPSKFPLPAAAQLKDSSKLTTPQKKDDLGPTVPAKTSEPVSPQMKPSGITKATTIPLKQASPATDHKKTQEREKRGQNKPLDQASQPTRKQSNVTLATQQESGGFLGFSGTTSHSASAKPAETVSGKMFGFGSSIFSSASTLITSAVQDQPKTTPPVSPKMSPAKEIKSPVVQKLEHQKKSEPPQQTKPPQSEQARVGKAPSELPKTVAASQVSSKQGQSTCPLCKTQLNMSSKNLPNYNTCTKCKNTVCNQCGFNPMPNETTLKEWLCLTCQMQRALGTQPPGITSVTSKIPADPDKKDISRTTEHEKKESAVPHIPQSKPSLTAQPAIADAGSKPDGQKQASPGHSQKMPQGPQKITGPKNVPDQTRQTERKLSNATPVTQQESGGFFGFGGGQSQPDVAKPAESVSGKMFGFGSSIFGSASTLISSAVQNQPKTTPPVSPKLSTVKEKKSPALQKKEEQKKTEQLQQTKTTPLVETKVEKGPSVHPKDAASCPLCKTELNMGSKDPSNYNTCTECKNTVCNKCGFNPAPNESEMKEWLCLTCQMQRALKAMESVEPPLMKPQGSPNKLSTSAADLEETTASQKKDVISAETAKDKKQGSPTPSELLMKEESLLQIGQTSTSALQPAEETAGTVSAPTTEEKTSLPPTDDVSISTTSPTKEITAAVSDISKPLPAQEPQVSTSTKTSLQEKKDLSSQIPSAIKKASEKNEETAEIIQKSINQLIDSSAEVQPKQALNKYSNTVERSLTTTATEAAQPANEESHGLFSFGSPKSQRAASIATEAVSGKMLGFGSSLFSSASALIASAVQDESQTTPPSSRKMSAPAQFSEKMSPKSSPPVSPRMSSTKEAKTPGAPNPHLEKRSDPTQQDHVPPSKQTKGDKIPSDPAKAETLQTSHKVGQPTCPLCKMELNMGSKDLPNYNTCTECKAIVCNKCGFSPMTNVAEEKEWLCLNCQMQRALGASEPPGLPLIKPQPSTSKDIPATTQKKETPMAVVQEDIAKPVMPKHELGNFATTKEPGSLAPSSPTEKVTSTAATLPDKTASSTIRNIIDSLASQKPCEETSKGQPDAPNQQSSKPVTAITKSTAPPDIEAANPPLTKPSKAGISPAKSAPPEAQPAKQESGGFFGFGGPKTQPTTAKSAESVKGKMFGFGTSFLSSASTLITSAVQDEPKTTPPIPRKMSATGHVSPNTTPLHPPKTHPAKDTKPLAEQKTEEKRPEKQQDKTPSAVPAKVDKTLFATADNQGALKADQSICPLCKVELNLGSKDPPNYNTCTECRTTVCNQCGFNPMPNVAEVKEWLCLNCQMHRALGASEPTGHPVVKPQSSPSKVAIPSAPKQNEMLAIIQKEKPKESTAVKTDITQAIPHKKETAKVEAPLPATVQMVDASQQGSVQKTQVLLATKQGQAQDVAREQQSAGKTPQVQLSQTTKSELKAVLAKQDVAKSPQQPSKHATPAAKSAPTPSQSAKQESGNFFGFGSPKTQTPAKSAESVTGKMFGFGSSIFSSATTLITSAVHEEPKTTPPTPRKMSTTAGVAPKTTLPVSPKMAPAKEAKPPTVQKVTQQTKPVPLAPAKVEKTPPEGLKVTQVTPKAGLSTCPICKVELNMGSKDPPNYNTCTECKNTVCHLCGFNPMPHSAVKEWLCLNCQTQRALLGQLGDSEKIPQPSPVSAKQETQATLAIKKAESKTALTKADLPSATTKSQPTSSPIKEVSAVPTPEAKMEPVRTEASTASTPKPDGPNQEAVTTVTVENNKKAIKLELTATEFPKDEESKPDLSKPKLKEDVFTTSSFSVPEATVVPTSCISAEVAVANVVPGAETKSEIKPTEPTQSLQQVVVQPKSQEPQPVVEQVTEADIKEVADKLVEKSIDITSSSEAQVSTNNNIIKEQAETKTEPVKPQTTEEDNLDNTLFSVTVTAKLQSKAEGDDEDQPQILPIPQESNDGKMVIDTSKDDVHPKSMSAKEDVKAGRRRLSFQALDESSESELTPSPSPQVRRRRLKITNISSSSEDIKTESADSIEDEEFIRKQIMGMGDEEGMSLSEDEKEKHLGNDEAIKKAELDNVSVTGKSLSRKGSTDNEDSLARKMALPQTGSETTQNVPETRPGTTFKKAIPAIRQRQSTDEEVESISESLSKGSSSVQVSSFTPGSSPTSASSLEEDSDSSPSHRKVSGDKQHRKGKHRKQTQALPTIEDSSEEDKVKKKERSRNEKEEFRGYVEPLSPTEDASSTEDLREVNMDATSKTSGSEYSASIESEPDVRRAVQRGCKPSPTVIPYSPSDQFKDDAVTKSLKSAEEAYEELIRKTKSIPGESPPDIEPLYGGMAIEDYLYESLVEEPEVKSSETLKQEPMKETSYDSHKKLRSPEEVYEEMMQKKRELMMIEQEFQQAQTAIESSSSVASVVETCVVTISFEETPPTGQTDVPLLGTETSVEMQLRKKKRPAPPRPTEPPKRSEITAGPSTPSGSIGFVRPMVPQDPALTKALFPIPDLKITQCSSGEEEDDSLADEYGVGISSDITPSDDSDTKDPFKSPTLSDTAEMEPISVIGEIPEPKPIPAPISAPELTSTPSPISPVSPPTSPATPDSSLASNATSSSSVQAQTPVSSDSVPMSTPTPPPLGISPPSSTTISKIPSTGVSCPTPTTVIVQIPDVVYDPSKAQTTTVAQIKATTTEHPTQGLVDISTSKPVVVQMPDLVSSPSQVPIEMPAVVQVTAPTPAPVVVSTQPRVIVTATPDAVSTTASARVGTASVTLVSSPGPVIVQMPDLVSTTTPISAQIPLPVSALPVSVTTPAQAQAKVVHSVPVQPAMPSVSPVVVPGLPQTPHVPSSILPSTTIVKKKVPPPPPPRSTSVSLPESNTEHLLIKTVQHVTTTMTTTTAMGTTVAGQPMQSVVVDIQPRMEDIPPDSVAVPQIVTPTRQGHVVIIVPSVENISLLGQTHDTASTGSLVSTDSLSQRSPTTTHQASDISSADTALKSNKVSAVSESSAPPLQLKPITGTHVIDTVQTPVAQPPTISPKRTAYPKSPVPTTVAVATTTIAQGTVTTTALSQTIKPPPPIPPKPVSIPAGLVFSHKPGESVKPPPSVAPKAATLPRTKEPPNALSLSLTRPVETKLGATSPKSPVSPRHAKCLQTYVVITLPSEPGSPTESITVQAPVRHMSIPSTKVPEVQATPSEQKTPNEELLAQTTVRRASVPSVRYPSPTHMPLAVAVDQVMPSEALSAKVEARRDSMPSVVHPPASVADVITVSLGQDTSIQVHSVPPPIKKAYVPLPPPQTLSEVSTIPPEPKVPFQPLTVQVQGWSIPSVAQHPNIVLPDVSVDGVVPEASIPTVPVHQQTVTKVVPVPLQPEQPLDALVPQDRPAAVPVSTVFYPQTVPEVEMLQKEEYMLTDVIVTEEDQRSPAPDMSPQIPVQKQLTVVESKCHFTEQEFLEDTHTTAELPQTVQPLDALPIVTERICSTQPHFVSEVMTLPTKIELPAKVIITDTISTEVGTTSPVPHPLPVAADVTLTPEVPIAMQQTTAAKMITPQVAVEVRHTPIMMEVQRIAVQAEVTPVAYIPQVNETCTSSVMSHSTPPLEVVALHPEHDIPTEIITNDGDVRSATISCSVTHPQTVIGMPVGVITTEETRSRRRTSISSIEQPAYTISEIFTYPTDYESPTQVITTEAFAATRRESINLQQPLPLPHIVTMPAEKDLSLHGYGVQVPYRRASIPLAEQQPQTLTYSSEYDKPLETITTETYARRMPIPSARDISQTVSVAPVTITKIQQESVESQEIRGPEKVVSSMSHMYSSISTSAQPPESVPSMVTQVVTTEVQRTTVSVVHERLQQPPPPSVAITIQPDIAKVQPLPKPNGKIIYPGDVIDLRTMKVGLKMTEQGMDLTPPESCRQSFSHDSSGRQITAVQPEIVNLSAEITPTTTLSVVTDSITIVTCTATIASYKNTPAEKPLDLQGPDTSSPVPLTTYKPFEPLAQIVYRPVNAQPKVSTVPHTDQDIPVNLSFGALVSSVVKQPMTSTPAVISNGGPVLSLEATGAMDLSNYKPVKAMVALYSTSPGVVTTVIEDDGTPVDLTAGRRSVCCDVIYKLPFTGSCRTQPPVTTQPDNRFGYRDDHYQYDNAVIYGIKGMNGIKASMSETNLTEAALFSYDPKNDFDYLSGSSDGAIDLTAAKLSAGKALDYTSKATGGYPGMTTAPFSINTAPGFGVNSALRTSDGIVYSSVAAPVPSTYAITTQPGSIFSTTLTPTSTAQKQSLLHPYGFIHNTDPGQIIPFDTGLPKELLPTALADIITGYPDMYSDTTLEAIAASLDALASSPIFPGLDNTKMAQYQMEREFLELEKLKQLCLAEELEWERQEIQRYREQEQLMVQRELEELQTLKQQLLLQQEEEHHAHMVAQQETYAQQKEQLQQIQQLQLQLQRQLDEHYSTSGTTGNLLDAKYAGVGDSGQYWPVKDESTTKSAGTQLEESQDQLRLLKKLQGDQDIGKKILDSGVQTDDEDSAEKQHIGRRKKNKRIVDTSAQTDDEDQDEWDAPTKARRRSRKHSSDGKHGSKVSSIAIQTVAEISVQTDHSGTIKRPNVQMDTKVEIIKHISAPENSQRGGSLSCQTDSEKRHTPIEVGYSTHLTADVPSKSNLFYTQVSPLSPEKSPGGQRMLTADPNRFSSGPRILKAGQKSLSDPKSLSPTTEDRMGGYYADSYSSRGSPSSTGKKVKRTLPDPPPEDDSLAGHSGYSTNSARRRLARSTTMARAKILQDIDKELDLVERESSKLRKKQAELDEEEKEIDAKLRLWAKRLP